MASKGLGTHKEACPRYLVAVFQAGLESREEGLPIIFLGQTSTCKENDERFGVGVGVSCLRFAGSVNRVFPRDLWLWSGRDEKWSMRLNKYRMSTLLRCICYSLCLLPSVPNEGRRLGPCWPLRAWGLQKGCGGPSRTWWWHWFVTLVTPVAVLTSVEIKHLPPQCSHPEQISTFNLPIDNSQCLIPAIHFFEHLRGPYLASPQQQQGLFYRQIYPKHLYVEIVVADETAGECFDSICRAGAIAAAINRGGYIAPWTSEVCTLGYQEQMFSDWLVCRYQFRSCTILLSLHYPPMSIPPRRPSRTPQPLTPECRSPVKPPWFPSLAMPPPSLLRPIQVTPPLKYPSMKEQSSATAVAAPIRSNSCSPKSPAQQQPQVSAAPLMNRRTPVPFFLSTTEYPSFLQNRPHTKQHEVRNPRARNWDIESL